MELMRLSLLTALTIAIVTFGAAKWIQTDTDSRLRNCTVENWNILAADYYFSANGDTLNIFPVEPLRDVEADSAASYFAHEKSRTLKNLGFKQVQVADRIERIE
jgi:hypothetical protein